MKTLSGRAAVITGASQGLGLEIARQFVREGADVVLCARTGDALARAEAELMAEAAEGQIVRSVVADVSKLEDVQRLYEFSLAACSAIDVLVLNAGIYGPFGPIEDVDWDAWVAAVSINLYGSVLPCRCFVPHFKARSYGKVIQLSGGGATAPLPRISAYAASKAAVVRFAETLAQEVKGYGIDVNAIAPGALDTRLLDEVLSAGPDVVGVEFHQRMTSLKSQGSVPLTVGASLAVYLASAASDGITGKLISAPWDPWSRFAEHRDELSTSDIYTLRRIVPSDRGMTWGDR